MVSPDGAETPSPRVERRQKASARQLARQRYQLWHELHYRGAVAPESTLASLRGDDATVKRRRLPVVEIAAIFRVSTETVRRGIALIDRTLRRLGDVE